MIKVLTFYKFFSMKKQILNLGKALNKAEQKSINGGFGIFCKHDGHCAHIPQSTCRQGVCD